MSNYDGAFNQATFSGTHMIIELWGVKPELLKDEERIKSVLTLAALDAKATVLSSEFHHFGEEYGLTGVVLLSESHISIHTWPEHGYAAVDIFMCGECDPANSLPALKDNFHPERTEVITLLRGLKKV